MCITEAIPATTHKSAEERRAFSCPLGQGPPGTIGGEGQAASEIGDMGYMGTTGLVDHSRASRVTGAGVGTATKARVAGSGHRAAPPFTTSARRAFDVFSPDGFLGLQRAAGNRAALAAVGACSHGHGYTVQRHSSWEHSLLGDAKPDVLAKIGTWRDLLEQTKREGTFVGSSNRWYKVNPNKRTVLGTPAQQTATVNLPGIGNIGKGDVMHVLVQEMSRVAKWQTDPPTGASTDKPYTEAVKDPVFDVVVVRLPAAGGAVPLLVTYGELNTLADFYGSLDVMKAADPKQRLQIVQSVRKETFLRLKEIYGYLKDSLTNTEKQNQTVGDAQDLYKDNKLDKTTFKGAAAPDFISGKAGQADLLAGDKPLIGQGTGAGGGVNAYGATLGRNACHFVPESWHAWADYHAKARAKARESRLALRRAKDKKAAMAQEDYSRRPLDMAEAQGELAVMEHEVTEAANEALLNNGFGDHYLQDSYASGHMINKTQIMQWYVEFIDTYDKWDYFKDDNWRRVQQMAYGQSGLANPDQYDKTEVKGYDPGNANPNAPRNPQSVENMDGGDWTVRFRALGLEVPPSLRTPGSPERVLMQWWQSRAAVNSDDRTLTGTQMGSRTAGRALGQPTLQQALLNLIKDGIVRTEEENQTRGKYMQNNVRLTGFADFGGTTFVLRSDYVPTDLQRFKNAVKSSRQGDDSAYQKMASSVTYGDFMMFLNSGFIQKATNALHDEFCKHGLTVLTAQHGQAFKVYGDDAMFSAASSEGVKESGITANRSRDAILSIINTGDDGGKTTASIMDRLPSFVRYTVPGTATVRTESLERWHNSNAKGALKDQCMTDIFPDMSWSLMQKFVPGVVGSDLGDVIMSDSRVHGQDAF